MDNTTTILSLLIMLFLSITTSIIKDLSYQKERKDLLNRLMAKDLAEYKDVNNNSLPKGKNHLKKHLENKDFEGYYE